MASTHLPNYLRANRKRLALSQDDVAYLLGAESGAKVCRYERFAREPGLHNLIACEVVLQKPIRELYPGLYEKITKEVAARAKQLFLKANHYPTPKNIRKHQTLTNIAKPKKTFTP